MGPHSGKGNFWTGVQEGIKTKLQKAGGAIRLSQPVISKSQKKKDKRGLEKTKTGVTNVTNFPVVFVNVNRGQNLGKTPRWLSSPLTWVKEQMIGGHF